MTSSATVSGTPAASSSVAAPCLRAWNVTPSKPCAFANRRQPVGEWILFTRFAFPGQLTRSFDIYVMRPDGTDVRPVTSTPDVAENAGDWRP